MSRLFPIKLLDGSDNVRLTYFAKVSIEHARLIQVTRQLQRAMNSRVKDSIIFVYGPAGVGKTTLSEHVINSIIKKNLSRHKRGKQYKEVPTAFVNSAAPDNNRFDWRYFYQHAIFTMESSIKNKRQRKFIPYSPRLAPALYFNQNLKPCEYRNHFIANLLKYLPFGLFIDEAQHLAKVKSADQLLNQMDIVKTIAHFSKTKIILIGPYDLLPFRNLSGQLSRRSWDIHFSRYTTSPEDLTEFQSAILTLQKKLPLLVEPDLVPHWKYIYTKSVGCIGTMKDWFMRALEIAVDEKETTITLDMLKECALSDNQSMNIALEISNGEQLVNGTEDSYKKLEETVGFTNKQNEKEILQKNGLIISLNSQKPIGKSKAGRPKAKRYPTGS